MLQELLNEMRTGVAFFAYKKKDGYIRYALGTTHTAIVNAYGPDLGDHPPVIREDQVRYFDMCAREWRSFNPKNLLDAKIELTKNPPEYLSDFGYL